MPRFETMPAAEGKRQKSEWLDNPDVVEMGGGKVNVFDVKPEEQKYDVPVFVSPAFGCRPHVYEYNINALRDAGRRVLAVDAPHGVETEEKSQKNIPKIVLRRVAGLLGTLDAKGIKQVDAMAHSFGGLEVVVAALLHPERFRNLALVDPAGVIGKDNILAMGGRFKQDDLLEKEVRKNKNDRNATDPEDFMRVLKGSPWKSIQEAFAIAGADSRTMLKELKKRGIGVSLIHAVDDKGFPMERVQGNIDTTMVDGLYSVKGTHNEMIVRPDLYTGLVEHALEAMERKEKAGA